MYATTSRRSWIASTCGGEFGWAVTPVGHRLGSSKSKFSRQGSCFTHEQMSGSWKRQTEAGFAGRPYAVVEDSVQHASSVSWTILNTFQLWKHRRRGESSQFLCGFRPVDRARYGLHAKLALSDPSSSTSPEFAQNDVPSSAVGSVVKGIALMRQMFEVDLAAKAMKRPGHRGCEISVIATSGIRREPKKRGHDDRY
jgi:hypothetical protein